MEFLRWIIPQLICLTKRQICVFHHPARNLGPLDVIVSLNYDTLLDSALLREGWDPRRGYDLMGGKGKFKGSIPRSFSPTIAAIKLLKLHGSLNWYVKGSFDNLPHIFDAKPSRILISTMPRTNELKGFIRQIIPPIYGKFFGHSHWGHLWAKAHAALVQSEIIVIIGCSLVDTDFHLTGMLGHAFAVRKQQSNPFAVAVVVNSLKVRRKWERLLKGCVTDKSSFNQFSQFAEKLRK